MSSEGMPRGQSAEGGIFTPWDQILARLERQYEAIIQKLDAKVDVQTFQAFQANYETRHERLQSQLEAFVKEAHERWEVLDKSAITATREVDVRLRASEAARERYIPQFEQAQKDIKALQTAQLAAEAVKKDRKVLYFGGGLVSLVVLVNLIINVVQGSQGAIP